MCLQLAQFIVCDFARNKPCARAPRARCAHCDAMVMMLGEHTHIAVHFCTRFTRLLLMSRDWFWCEPVCAAETCAVEKWCLDLENGPCKVVNAAAQNGQSGGPFAVYYLAATVASCCNQRDANKTQPPACNGRSTTHTTRTRMYTNHARPRVCV